MAVKKIPVRLWCIVILSLGVGGRLFLSHTLTSHLPLGYDPGVYKSMMEAYMNVGGSRDRSLLPSRIQRMYPPFVGMQFSIVSLITGVGSGRMVHSGIIGLIALLLGGIYYYTKQLRGKTAALIAVCFAMTSFVTYNVYRRGYIKQLFACLFLLFSLGLFAQKKWRAAIPFMVAGMVSQRPLLVIMGCIFVIGWLCQFREGKKHRIDYLLCFGVAVTATLSLYGPLVSKLLVPLFQPFLDHLGFSVSSSAGFQSGGTFLTLLDYVRTNRIVLGMGLTGVIFAVHKRKTKTNVFLATTLLLFLRVFGESFFFQRMIGYLDVMLLVGGGIAGARFLERWKRGWLVLIILRLLHTGQSLYRHSQIKYPIIEQSEFAFIQEIDTLIEEESVIIVPGIQYSPWIAGWTNAEVIAPGLFDLNERGKADGKWQSLRREATAQEKCDNVSSAYGSLGKTLYVRIGSKQELTDVAGVCFQLIKAGGEPFHALYRLDFEENNEKNN